MDFGGGFVSPGGGSGITIGGGGGGIGFPGSGGPTIWVPPIGGGNPGSGGGSGKATPVSVSGSIGGALSSVLGIPAINWGRIAAFLLGLLLIAGGIYLIRPVQKIVNQSVRSARSAAIEA